MQYHLLAMIWRVSLCNDIIQLLAMYNIYNLRCNNKVLYRSTIDPSCVFGEEKITIGSVLKTIKGVLNVC